MAMATDPFDPCIASLQKGTVVRRDDPSPPAHLPPFALVIPTLLGPVAIERSAHLQEVPCP